MPFSIRFIDIISVLPVLILWGFSLFFLMFKFWRPRLSRNLTSLTVVAGLACLLALVGQNIAYFQANALRENLFWNGLLIEDGLGHVLTLWAILLTLITLVFWRFDRRLIGEDTSENLFLWLFSLGAILLVFKSQDLLAIFVHLEAAFLPIYVLIGLGQDHELSKESAIKYFIWGGVSGAIFLVGMSLIYMAFGHLSLETISRVIENQPTTGVPVTWALGAILMLVALLIKWGHFPFHFWVADVYQGASSTLAGWISSVGKMVTFAILVRIVGTNIYVFSEKVQVLLAWLVVVGVWVGNLLAFKNQNIKRLLAYSGVSNIAFVLLALLATWQTTAGVEIQSGLIYLLVYTLSSTVLFNLVMLLEKDLHHQVHVEELRGLGWKQPFWGVVWVVLLLSLAGLPPLWGFFAKFYVILDAIEARLLWPAIWVSIGSIVGLVVYLRPVAEIFLKDYSSTTLMYDNYRGSPIAVTLASLIAILTLGVASEWVIQWLNQF